MFCIKLLLVFLFQNQGVCISSENLGLSPGDPSSYSRPDIAVISHIDLDWTVDFDQKLLNGSVTLTFNVLKETSEIILDESDLNISAVSLEGSILRHEICDTVPNFGSKLTVYLPSPAPADTNLVLLVVYSSSSTASALQWLAPEQTFNKLHPYLLSQSSPIHARSILPCQDSPTVKFTYSATVQVPTELTVLMSALRSPPENGITKFNQPVPIPSNLIAIAVGDLVSKRLGPRTLVWSDQSELERAASEFADTERYLQAAEKMCGEYIWQQYDLLVLPSSFPYGGMENPCLTFVTPTLLTGDRSQAEVIIHEIVHSWSGNLVTHSNFEHFWLKEGFTVFLERKVAASLIGDPSAARKSRDFECLLGLQELNHSVSRLGASNPMTRLVLDLHGIHPDDSFSIIPYEKGSLFLRYLEDIVGGPQVFDDFVRTYFQNFNRQSINTEQFKTFLLNYFVDRRRTTLEGIDWNTWLHGTGMPPVIPQYDTTLANSCRELADRIHSEPTTSITHEDVSNFSSHQIVYLLQELLVKEPLPLEMLHAIGVFYDLNTSQNSEIVFRYLSLSLESRDESIVDRVLSFLNSTGRMKYVRPLYRQLYAWNEMRNRAIENFLQHEGEMMHVVAYTLRQDLHLNAPQKK